MDGTHGRGVVLGRAGLTCVAVSIGLIVLTGLLGPSAAQPPLGRRGWHPPYWFNTDPSPWLVTGLQFVALAVGAAGVVLGLRATSSRYGWSPDPRRLLAGSVLAAAAMVVVPPMGSADVLVYAAYGRIAALGGDPYAQTPRDLAMRPDPVGQAVDLPWQDTTSVYGPLGTFEQRIAATLAGPSVHGIVFLLALTGAVAFVVTGLLLLRCRTRPAAQERAGQVRVLLLWSLNPLLLYGSVNGAHIDGFAMVWAVAALVVIGRSAASACRPAFVAGLFAGVAVAVKLPFGLFVLALLWALLGVRLRAERGELRGEGGPPVRAGRGMLSGRAEIRRAGALLAGVAVVVLPAYTAAGPHVFDQVRESSRFVSFATPWRVTVGPLEALFGADVARQLIGALTWLAMIALAVLLARAFPLVSASHSVQDATASVEASATVSAAGAPAHATAHAAARAAAVLTFAWLLTAPYSLPWYDVMAWGPFVLLAATPFDGLLLARSAGMAFAYIPGRVVTLPDGLDVLTRGLRGTVMPVVMLVVLTLVVQTAFGARTRTRTPPRTPPAPAARRS